MLHVLQRTDEELSGTLSPFSSPIRAKVYGGYHKLLNSHYAKECEQVTVHLNPLAIFKTHV